MPKKKNFLKRIKNFLADAARRKKPSKRITSKFPRPGTVFVMPLKNGRLGVCRVVRLAVPPHCKSVMPLVVASDWIGDNVPEIEDPAVRRTLVINHHSWKNSPQLIWVNSPPPKDFRKIGNIKVLSEDKQSTSLSGTVSV